MPVSFVTQLTPCPAVMTAYPTLSFIGVSAARALRAKKTVAITIRRRCPKEPFVTMLRSPNLNKLRKMFSIFFQHLLFKLSARAGNLREVSHPLIGTACVNDRARAKTLFALWYNRIKGTTPAATNEV